MNNSRQRPDPSEFKVRIDDDDFGGAQETLDSINGTQRINIPADILDDNRDNNPYNNDKKDKRARKEHKKRDTLKVHK